MSQQTQQYGTLQESQGQSSIGTEPSSIGGGAQTGSQQGTAGSIQPGAAGGSMQSSQSMQQGGQSMQQGGQSMQQGGQSPLSNMKLEEAMTDEMRVALHDFVQAATVCEWCAERCIDEGPQMAECLRLCRDVADLATLNIQLISRDSAFGPEVAEVFATAAEACAQECAQHSHRHCQECAETLGRAVRTTRKMLASFGQQTGQSGTPQFQQSGSPITQSGQSPTQQGPPRGSPGQQF